MFKSKVAVLIALLAMAGTAQAQLTLDGDSPSTGSDLGTQPLATQYGTVTFTGQFFADGCSDDEFIAAGASGGCFDHTGSGAEALLDFGFDVCNISFIYGGNGGDIFVEARRAGGNVVDSFSQGNTGLEQPAGPESLSGDGIRQLAWFETAGSYAPLDNIEVTPCDPPAPVPAFGTWSILLLLLMIGGTALYTVRRSH